MCGRFALFATEDELSRRYAIKQSFKMQPRYNVTPGTFIPVVQQNQLDFMRWGFIARWVKADDGLPKGHINARVETAQEKPTFKQAILKRRCIVPVSGYFEWKTIQGKKQPYFIFVKNESILSLGGIWERYVYEHETVDTVAILTTAADQQMQSVHHRMPVHISPNAIDTWLNPQAREAKLTECLQQLTQPSYQVRAVSTSVNNPQNDSIGCIQPLT